ncbi:CDP-4-dehydro-6-deoxyglucose reductase [Paraburkholderia sp. BL27I4N3]|uniref:FAD-binding oxidoreductase n=1 Tax=Paraburkholderia sp. BL27I4N3 TaxID=1938805 RepID=UPI000E393E68|nr:FAD-binding oxidoreductase [Paraburkholderia sp. BL27I4N3]REE06616.1 CDP-4-dehydro-6-deoxyglucose reductase [Paraburkholderia sp. BL27I4N3]
MHTITINPAGVELQCGGEATILDAAMTAGFFPRHSCRRGECRACEVRVVQGEVRYPDNVDLDSIRAGHCLTCVARPSGDLVIEAPEVTATPGRPVIAAAARVTSVSRVSRDVSLVRLQIPITQPFMFEPGQYLDVILKDGTRRSYSMANSPNAGGQVELHVRALPGGRFSQHVYNNLKPRDLLRIEGPFGTFKLSTSTTPVILLASGTGFAPILSIIRSHGSLLQSRGAALYWGGLRPEDLYGLAGALDWVGQSASFSFIPVISNPGDDWQGRKGFVHAAVQEDFPDMSGLEVYACGNPLMVDAARTAFTDENRLPPQSFFSDAFVTTIPTPQQSQTAEAT